MYNKYFKQRKFGKVLSFFLVINSGITYYIKFLKDNLYNILSFKNLINSTDYLPKSISNSLESIKKIYSNNEACKDNNLINLNMYKLSSNLDRSKVLSYNQGNLNNLIINYYLKACFFKSYFILYYPHDKKCFDKYMFIVKCNFIKL